MADLSKSLEDYLETIYLVSKSKRIVRVKDLVERLGVRTSSVVSALKKLESRKLVLHESYSHVDLTPEGERVAGDIFQKHRSLYRFLSEVLFLDATVSEVDACKIEHCISDKSLARINQFINFIETCPSGSPLWLKSWHDFMKTGKRPDHLHCADRA